MQVIILVGGMATRLKDITHDEVAKCMVPINGIPFMDYQLLWINSYDVNKVIFAVGGPHTKQIIDHINYLKPLYKSQGIELCYSIEDTPLGTGGALKKAWELTDLEEQVVMMNGDVYQDFDLDEFNNNCEVDEFTLSLVKVNDISRYGAVTLYDDCSIKSWSEKGGTGEGLISRGVYIINSTTHENPFKDYPDKFSFENDYMPNEYHKCVGLVTEGDFIDIGTPETYQQFCEYLSE